MEMFARPTRLLQMTTSYQKKRELWRCSRNSVNGNSFAIERRILMLSSEEIDVHPAFHSQTHERFFFAHDDPRTSRRTSGVSKNCDVYLSFYTPAIDQPGAVSRIHIRAFHD